MRINGLRCDGCGKEHLIDSTRIIENAFSILPAGWFMTLKGPYEHNANQEPWVFCSKNCLRHHPLGEERT